MMERVIGVNLGNWLVLEKWMEWHTRNMGCGHQKINKVYKKPWQLQGAYY